jgi:uncharacterized protein
MEFFCYHRDRAGSTPLRVDMTEEHWSYMDRFDGALVARGPTFADDETLSGSVHVVDLPDAAAARAFAFEEPCYQAGAYRDVMLRRWSNGLGRTMWEYAGDREAEKYLVLGFTGRPEPAADLPAPRDDLIAFGPLLSDDGLLLLGAMALLAAPDAETARVALDPDRYVGVEVHRWEFGGRRDRPAG